jgi:hypothetical protein|tara:strand:- start:23 stop:529 length:507 start_codon:yes stop_codon:yes gene_type:complete
MISTRIDNKTEDTYKNLSSSQKRSWRNQDKFLTAYSETRSKTVACSYAGVKYRTVMKWQKENYFGFMDRLQEADLLFCEGLEQLALERVKMQDAKSNPVLLITLLNANLPNKYRPTVVMNDDTAKDVLRELRTMAKSNPVPEPTETNEPEETAIEQVNKILNEKGGMA